MKVISRILSAAALYVLLSAQPGVVADESAAALPRGVQAVWDLGQADLAAILRQRDATRRNASTFVDSRRYATRRARSQQPSPSGDNRHCAAAFLQADQPPESAVESSPANPFATRHVRPGSLPFFFGDEDSETVEGILAKLRANAWRGEIVGPHGSGKTTLLVQLLQAARDAGQHVTLFSLNDRQRRLPRDWQAMIAQARCVAIDGYEQLGAWARWRLKRFCRRHGIGLVVTAHAPTGLPTLYHARPSTATARKVVEQLLPPDVPPPSDDELSHLIDVFHGNVREVLFALYDRYEPPR